MDNETRRGRGRPPKDPAAPSAKKYNIFLPAPYARRLDEISQEEGCTPGQWIRSAVIAALGTAAATSDAASGSLDEGIASRFVAEAQTYLRGAVRDPEVEYLLQGYVAGVRRAWHGEGFDEEKHRQLTGTPEEEIFDDARRLMVIGYKAGIAGKAPREALEMLKKDG